LLGLGPTPIFRSKSAKYDAKTKKFKRYQLTPKLITIINGEVASISCGESHCLCLLANGALLGWGQNNCGQVGCGPNFDGYLMDILSPVLISPFSGRFDLSKRDNNIHRFVKKTPNFHYCSNLNTGTRNARSSSCGAFHSICLDDSGNVWTWGARGNFFNFYFL
jgi:alpha-tubulin suppressor-like RCC1 family protein